MIRKQTLVIIGVILGLFIVAGLLWTRGYNRANVHPVLLAMEEPLKRADAHSLLIPAAIRLEFVDARGQFFQFFLPEKYIGRDITYPELVVLGVNGSPSDVVTHPCSRDSQKFIAMLIAKYMAPGPEQQSCLKRLRYAPKDELKHWWKSKRW